MANRKRTNNKKRRYSPPFRGFPQIFGQGYDAFFKGHLNAPYKRGTMKEKEWQRGFNAGYFDNLKYLENA